MAFLQIDCKSASLQRRVHLNVFLPSDVPGAAAPYPSLYLLHGIFGSSVSWVTSSCVQRYAEERKLCVVMPDGENGFYLDHPETLNLFSSWVGKELVEVTRAMLPLSHRREDTYLGGFSMGGYGALRNGLLYADTFGAILAFSSALILSEVERKAAQGPGADPSYMRAMFGNLSRLTDTDLDPAFLARRLVEDGRPLPRMYLSCGEQDSLLEANRDFARALEQMGADFTFRTAPGGHDWDFWEQEIRYVLRQWL